MEILELEQILTKNEDFIILHTTSISEAGIGIKMNIFETTGRSHVIGSQITPHQALELANWIIKNVK